jgi:hypothetical protein
MGGSPPPPPPPARQPYEGAKESSMYWRNRSYSEAVAAATNSYKAAATLKALVDILDPLTDQQLRAAINEHYRLVTEYRRAQIIYTTTVKTFLEVDGLIKAAIDKLTSIRSLGETHLNHFESSVIQFISGKIINLYTQQSELQKIHQNALANLNTIRTTYEPSLLTTDEKLTIYNTQYGKLVTACNNATTLVNGIVSDIETMKTRVTQMESLDLASKTRGMVGATIVDTNTQLQNTTLAVLKTYTVNLEQLKKELERVSKWYSYYKTKADLVRDKKKVIINPAVFRTLLDLAKSAHMDAIYAALYAVSADWNAWHDRNVVNPAAT